MRYRITFDRIGRNTSVPNLDVPVTGLIAVGEAISDYAGKFLASTDYDVGVDNDMSGGHIIAGMHEVGTFKIMQVG